MGTLSGLEFLIGSIVVFGLVAIYARPALSGITKRRLRMRGLVGGQFRKHYELEGIPAFLMGCFLLALCLFFLIGWILFVINALLPK